jgi:phage gp29-like protein
MIEGEALPERKLLCFQYEADPENPYGVGLGQSCYWPWWFKKHGIKFWVVFMERFGMPFPLGKYPPGTPKEQQDALLDVLKTFTTDTAAKIPNTMEVDFLEAQRGSTVAVYDPFVDKMNAEISKAVLGQTATTEGTPGALGSEQARSQVRQDIVLADADLLDEVITDQLIRWIVDFNVGPDVPAPVFHTKLESEPDLMDQWRMSFRDRNLQGMGLAIPEKYAREKYGVPAVKGDEPVLLPPAPFAPGQDGGLAGVGFAEQLFDGLFAETDRRIGRARRR